MLSQVAAVSVVLPSLRLLLAEVVVVVLVLLLLRLLLLVPLFGRY